MMIPQHNQSAKSDFSTPKAGALEMARRGFRVFPLHPNRKDPFDKRRGDDPFLCGGIHIATTDPAKIEAWFAHNPAINYGVSADGLVMVDVDPRKGPDGEWISELIALGPIPDTFRVLTQGGGQHIYFKGRSGQQGLSPCIDVRSRGGYVVGPGSAIDGRRYTIHTDAPAAPLPPTIAGKLAKGPTPAETAEGPHGAPETPLEHVRQALEHVTPDDRDDWLRVGMGLKLAFGEDAFDLWDDWSRKTARDNYAGPEDQRYHWDSFQRKTGRLVTPLSILRRAYDSGWTGPKADPRDEFESLAGVAELAEWWERRIGRTPPVLDPRDPMPSARELVARRYTVRPGELRSLHYAAGDFLSWRGTHYERIDGDAMRAAVWRFLEAAKRSAQDRKSGERTEVPFQPNRDRVSNVCDALKAAAELPGCTSLPTWVNPAGRPPAAELLPCANGLLHLPTCRLLPHTPEFVNVNALPYGYDPDAPRPVEWLRFLDSLWGDDPETIATLQEWFGYCLTQDTRQHKIAMLIGPPRAGKGVTVAVLKALLGPANVCGPTLASLGKDFGLQPLLDKQLAITPDERLSSRADQATIAARLLSLSGGDTVSVERKHTTALQMRLPIKFMVVTNELPRIGDASGALASRFLVLEFRRSFLGKEDTGLESRLLAELPGILLWALEGLERLNSRGHFVQPASAQEKIQQLADLTTPIRPFLRECCELGSDKWVERDRLYKAWCSWCKHAGHYDGSRETFGKDLAAFVPGLRQNVKKGGVRGYGGIDLVGPSEFEPIDPAEPSEFEPIDLSDLAPLPPSDGIRDGGADAYDFG